MGRGGLEPPTHGFSIHCQGELTDCRSNTSEPCKKNLAENLALLVQEHPDLAQIGEAWPNLPEHIKQAIKALINTAADCKNP